MAQSNQRPENPLIISNQPSRSDELLITSVLIGLLLLIGVIGLFWSGWTRLVFAPTPTATMTPSEAVTLTPDGRATQIALQLVTQTVVAEKTLAARETDVAVALSTTSPSSTDGGDRPPPQATGDAAAAELTEIAANSPLTTTGAVTSTLVISATPSDRATELAPTELDPTELNPTELNPTELATSTGSSTVTVNLPTFPIPSPPPGDEGGDPLETPEPTPESTPAVNAGGAITQTTTVTNTIDEAGSDDTAGPDTDPGQPSTSTIYVPAVSNPEPVVDNAAVPPATATDIPVLSTPDSETPLPTDTPEPLPTDTPTPEPEPTDTPIPSPTPTTFVQDKLKGIVNVEKAKLRRDPDGAEISGELPINREMELTSRVATGEWINICCIEGQGGWIRQAQLTIQNNTLDSDAPEDAEPNDARWLRIDEAASTVPSQVAPVPVGTYPLPRGNGANYGLMSELPATPLISVWDGRQGRASGLIISPITLSASGLLVSTQDGNIFSFDKESGDERWRFGYSGGDGGLIRGSVISAGNQLYAVDDAGFVYRIEDRGSEAAQIWRIELKLDDQRLVPATEMTMQGSCLYVGARRGDAHYLVSIRQSDGKLCFTAKSLSGTSMQYPALGGQLIFVGTDRGVFARDAKSGDEIWAATQNLGAISTAPIYSYPGIDALAELYVVRGGSEVVALNANTGKELWRLNVGQTVTSMALRNEFLYVSGKGFIKKLSRIDHNEVASLSINGNIPGGPLLNGNILLAVTEFANLTFVDANSLELLESRTTGSANTTSFVANGPLIYVHDSGTAIQAFRTQQQ